MLAPTPARAMVARPAPRPLETGENKRLKSNEIRESMHDWQHRIRIETHFLDPLTTGVKMIAEKAKDAEQLVLHGHRNPKDEQIGSQRLGQAAGSSKQEQTQGQGHKWGVRDNPGKPGQQHGEGLGSIKWRAPMRV